MQLLKKIIVSLFMIFALVGCTCSKETKVTLDYVTSPTSTNSSTYLYDNYSLLSYEISLNEYDSKIANKDSFLIFVYREGCEGCRKLAPALKDYVDNKGIVIYTINYANIESKRTHALYKDEGINTTPYLILVENGNIKKKELVLLDGEIGSKENSEEISKWLNENIIWEEK